MTQWELSSDILSKLLEGILRDTGLVEALKRLGKDCQSKHDKYWISLPKLLGQLVEHPLKL